MPLVLLSGVGVQAETRQMTALRASGVPAKVIGLEGTLVARKPGMRQVRMQPAIGQVIGLIAVPTIAGPGFAIGPSDGVDFASFVVEP